MKFLKIRLKNFQSIGRNTIEIVFKEGITLFSGENGSGKSTIISALQFLWNGKTSDGKTKKELVNRFNKKDCMVEFEFEKNDDVYIIGRKINPDSNYIIKNGVIEDYSGSKKFNEYIFKLLGIDKKFSEHTIFLSKDFYKPFLRLRKQEKRDFLKKIFDFGTYEKMEERFKENLKKIENDLIKIDRKKEGLELLIENNLKRFNEENSEIERLKKENNDILCDLSNRFNDCREKFNSENKAYHTHLIELRKGYNDTLNDFITEKKIFEYELENNEKIKKNKYELEKKINELKNNISDYNIIFNEDELILSINKLKELELKRKYYENNDICKECGREITDELKFETINDVKKEIKELKKEIKEKETIKKQYTLIQEHNKLEKELNDIVVNDNKYDKNITSIDKKISVMRKHIDCVEKRLNEHIEFDKKIEKLENEISFVKKALNELENREKRLDNLICENEKYSNDIDNINKNLKKLNKKEIVFKKLLIMVQDKGIKKFIISNYIPILNKIAKKYIELLNSRFSIKFDKTGLDIKILNRGVEINYFSLSGGEKQRIDLAMLFTWLEFSRLKNNTIFPFLSLDEILDGSLDREGVSDLGKILKMIKENIKYIFVISHNIQNSYIADYKINVSKKGKWSMYNYE